MKSNPDLSLSSYDYELPVELIAQRPNLKRDESRLLFWDSSLDKLSHHKFKDITELLPRQCLLVMNQTKVFPCRLLAKKETGGRAEIFVLSTQKDHCGNYECMVKTTGKKKRGDRFSILKDESVQVEIKEQNPNGTFQLFFSKPLIEVLENCGSIPLPPYVRNGVADEKDSESYQTVYSKEIGSVAAPTAGLHFTQELLEQLQIKGVDLCPITLHVGPGTFAPVKSENITDHKMHFENFLVSSDSQLKLKDAWEKKIPVIAVGTTSLRCIESIYNDIKNGQDVSNKWQSTNIFLYPGKKVQSAQGLITNFHLPKSSLIMLVASLIGREKIIDIYKQAIKEKYRFYSYGDAMLLKLW